MKKWIQPLLLALTVAAATPVLAAVPQTIIVDGLGGDWNPANLVQDDSLDTETKNWCTNDPENESPMDIGKVFLTNDANFLYVGFFYDKDCFQSPQVNLGMAIDVNGAAGGTSDAFGRRLSWTEVPNKPDFTLYDVLDAFNYEILYQWTGAAWNNISTSVNPSWGNGSNGLGIQDGTTFKEFKLPLSVLGVIGGSTLRFEIWTTQDGTTKGPLDAVCSDTSQASTPAGTIFDFAAGQTRTMDCMIDYVVLSTTDTAPPTVTTALAVNFPLNANKQFGLTTNKVDVAFSEPVELVSAQATGNYSLTGPLSRSIIDATRDAAATNVVHLTLSGSINANAAVYNLTATGVKDLANNTIIANGTTNVGKFFIKNVLFEGSMALRLCKGEFAVSDSFSIEGSLLPLTFALTDNAVMYDANSDSVYTVTVPFCLPFNPDSGKGVADLEWKFGRKNVAGTTQEFEPGGNRPYHVVSTTGATDTLRASWANDSGTDFTDRPVDVIFRVDANPPYLPPSPTRKIWLRGSELPLSFNSPGLAMKDDGVLPDQTAGDKVFTLKVRFPRCSNKNVRWKVVYDSTAIDTVYECPTQGDREVFVNSAVFDTVGGTNGALSLPSRGVNRCTVTDKAIRVVFRLDMTPAGLPAPAGTDTVGIAADVLPLGRPNLPAASIMADNGVSPDASAGDKVYTREVTFPDSSASVVAYKFWYDNWTNGGYECDGFGDRNLRLDDYTYSVANPILLPIYAWNYCANLVDVPFGPVVIGDGPDFAILRQSFPNPINSKTTIFFDLKRAGRVTLSIYDIGGRRLAKILDRDLPPGRQSVVWDGRNGEGLRLGSGVYVYELAMGGDRISRRMVVAR